ncbi:MAG: DUF6263 family protein [Geitlerinemataceae cyanobacterium]
MKKRWLAGALTGAIALGGFSLLTPVQAEAEKKTDRSAPNLVLEATSPEPAFSLLDAGVEPRQPLRFVPQANEMQTITITLQTNVAMAAGGQVLPSVDAPASTMTVESTITQVDDNGDIHYQMYYTGIEVGESPNAPPELRQVLEAQMQNLVGAGGTFVMDSRGHVKETNFSLSENADAMTQQLFQEVSQSVRQLSTPFPEEAVGLGARWQIAQALEVNGMELTQNAIYELVSLQDNVATLNISLEQQAPSQEIEIPGLPDGATVTLNSLQSQGEGQVTIQLDRLMSESGTMSMQSDTDMKISQAGMSEEMPMTSSTTIQMDWRSQ